MEVITTLPDPSWHFMAIKGNAPCPACVGSNLSAILSFTFLLIPGRGLECLGFREGEILR